MLFTEFGIGVGDRTAATLRYVNNANWSDGTPTSVSYTHLTLPTSDLV